MKCCLHKDCWSLQASVCGCALLRLFLNTGHVQGCSHPWVDNSLHPWVDNSLVWGVWVAEPRLCFCCKVCCLGGNNHSEYLISVTSTRWRLRGRVWHHRHASWMDRAIWRHYSSNCYCWWWLASMSQTLSTFSCSCCLCRDTALP